MSLCTAAPWDPAESPSSPPPPPDYATGSPGDPLRWCPHRLPRCARSPCRSVSGGGGGAAALPRPPLLCSCRSRSPRRCCRRGCRCCRRRTRRTRRRISAGSHTGSGPLPGETAPSARTPPSPSAVMLPLLFLLLRVPPSFFESVTGVQVVTTLQEQGCARLQRDTDTLPSS